MRAGVENWEAGNRAALPSSPSLICYDTASSRRRAADLQPLKMDGCNMLTPTAVFADAFGKHVAALYDLAYSRREARFGEMLCEAARLVFERISLSDALY